MKSTNLSKRLKAIADMVSESEVVCDIGCDHALLPIYLVESHRVKRALATDVNEKPLEAARSNIKEAGLFDKIETRLSDGFSAIKSNEADCAIIAGMGGLLMRDILIRGESVWKKMQTLILSPHRDEYIVREYLADKACYEEDLYVKEGKEFYVIMKFNPQKIGEPLEETQLLYGKNPSKEFIHYKKQVLNRILDSLEKGNTEDIIKRKSEVEKELKLLRSINEGK